MIYNTQYTFSGIQTAARLALSTIPHVEAIFQPLSGERLIIANGDKSAKFKKATDTLHAALNLKKCQRVMVDWSRYSVSVKVDEWLTNPERTGTEYFKDYYYIGELDEGRRFTYTLNKPEVVARLQAVIDLDYNALLCSVEAYTDFLKQADDVKALTPYAFRDFFKV